jgi:hypothetical protein
MTTKRTMFAQKEIALPDAVYSSLYTLEYS